MPDVDWRMIDVHPGISFSEDDMLQKKIELICEGMLPNVQKLFNELSDDNKKLVAAFLADFMHYENISPNTRRAYLLNLVYLVRYWKGQSLKSMTRENINTYLQSLKRTKIDDPDDKWMSTHNHRAMAYLKFFKWLAYPDVPHAERKTPDAAADIKFYKRKEKTSVKASDLWTPVYDMVFLKYCPDARIAFYHTASDDTSVSKSGPSLSKQLACALIGVHAGTDRQSIHAIFIKAVLLCCVVILRSKQNQSGPSKVLMVL